jgi:hypothetical protein
VWRDSADRGLTGSLRIFVFAAVVRCVVHMHAIDVIGKRQINIWQG